MSTTPTAIRNADNDRQGDRLDAHGVAWQLAADWVDSHVYVVSHGWYYYREKAAGGLWVRDPEASKIRRAVSAWLRQASKKKTIRSRIRTLEIVRELEAIMHTVEFFDAHPDRVGLIHGSFYNFREANSIATMPTDRISRALGAYPIAGSTPNWDMVLGHIARTDAQHEWLRLWLGYCLTGHTREARFVFMQGPQSGGKSTLLDVMRRVAGDFHVGVPEDALTGTYGRHREWLARLEGARVCTVPELGTGAWKSVLLKALVAGDQITANFMRKGSFDFVPKAKFMLAANHKPRIQKHDSGLQRRLVLIPTRSVPSGHRDKHLRENLEQEMPAITHWFCKAASEYIERGSLPLVPTEWMVAQENYFEAEDDVATWFSERVEVTGDENHFAEGTKLLESYAESTNRRANRTEIYDWLDQQNFPGVGQRRQRIVADGNPVRGIVGLKLR